MMQWYFSLGNNYGSYRSILVQGLSVIKFRVFFNKKCQF